LVFVSWTPEEPDSFIAPGERSDPGVPPPIATRAIKPATAAWNRSQATEAGRVAGAGDRPGLRLGQQPLPGAAAEEFGAKAGPGQRADHPNRRGRLPR
jgi:hypothetical protein